MLSTKKEDDNKVIRSIVKIIKVDYSTYDTLALFVTKCGEEKTIPAIYKADSKQIYLLNLSAKKLYLVADVLMQEPIFPCSATIYYTRTLDEELEIRDTKLYEFRLHDNSTALLRLHQLEESNLVLDNTLSAENYYKMILLRIKNNLSKYNLTLDVEENYKIKRIF